MDKSHTINSLSKKNSPVTVYLYLARLTAAILLNEPPKIGKRHGQASG